MDNDVKNAVRAILERRAMEGAEVESMRVAGAVLEALLAEIPRNTDGTLKLKPDPGITRHSSNVEAVLSALCAVSATMIAVTGIDPMTFLVRVARAVEDVDREMLTIIAKKATVQ